MINFRVLKQVFPIFSLFCQFYFTLLMYSSSSIGFVHVDACGGCVILERRGTREVSRLAWFALKELLQTQESMFSLA